MQKDVKWFLRTIAQKQHLGYYIHRLNQTYTNKEEYEMYEVMVTVISKKGELKTVVKGFKTDAARTKWIEKKWDAGEVYEVRAYKDDR